MPRGFRPRTARANEVIKLVWQMTTFRTPRRFAGPPKLGTRSEVKGMHSQLSK